jgi:hypothetical protein
MKFESLRIANSISRTSTREEVVELAVHLMKRMQVWWTPRHYLRECSPISSQLSVKPLPLERVHELSALSRKGPVTLACNGKKKVACILDENGVIESLDLSTEPEEF